MPTVYHLDDAMSWRGGEQQVAYLHRGLLARGWDSTVICRRGGALHQRLEAARLPHRAMTIRGSQDLHAAWKIGSLARKHRALLHAHTSHAHDLSLWASRLRGRFPLVVSRRVDFPVGRSFFARRKYLSDRIDRYYAISSAVESELLAASVAADRIRRVPSGIDLSRFPRVEPMPAWREAMKVAPDELLFGNVAALAPHKDQATLLRAFARYVDGGGRGKLVILGEGELRGDLEALRDRLRLRDRVLLPGFVSDILPRVRSLDVFVMSSSLEGLGTSILDAMALERCIVATRTGGIPDAIVDERNGILVPPRDPEALAAALHRLAQDAQLRRSLAAAAREDVQAFSVEHTVAMSEAAYLEVLEERIP
jgi:glycosyltransferase involved in cell wall biosynthesis